MTSTISHLMRELHLARLAPLFVSAVICLWIANVTPIGTFAAADQTCAPIQLA